MSHPTANKTGREALRGAEVETVDLIFDVLTPDQRAKLLKAPLERTVAKGQRELAQMLVRAGAEIGEALHDAVRGDHGEIVGDLLESGVPIDVKDKSGRAPLHVAAGSGKTEMVQQLLLKGANKDAFSRLELTPLFLAGYRGHSVTVRALLAAGANVNLRCGRLKDPVILGAAAKGRVEVVRTVTKHGADVEATNTQKNTALHIAAWNNKADVIDVLVGAGANIEARDRRGYTPVHCASSDPSLEALLCLLKHGAAVNAQAVNRQTPLMVAAVQAGRQGVSEMVDALLRAGADETLLDGYGRKASMVIGTAHVEDDDEHLIEDDVNRVRELVANAPADRAWRRRGYLVLCRAHLGRVQQHSQVVSGTQHTETGRTTSGRAKLEGTKENAGGSALNESTGGDWAVMVTKVLHLREEGVFRTIVGYL